MKGREVRIRIGLPLIDWLENMLEDNLEFTDEFKAKIERGEQDIRAGRVRLRKP